jgi:hypothetical protein
MASEQISIPVEYSLSALGNTLANQLMKRITSLGVLFRYEMPDGKDLTIAEKKVIQINHTEKTRQIQNILFNVFHFVKVISNICDELKTG